MVILHLGHGETIIYVFYFSYSTLLFSFFVKSGPWTFNVQINLVTTIRVPLHLYWNSLNLTRPLTFSSYIYATFYCNDVNFTL